MKKRIVLLQIALVLLVGEALFRFDEATLFFQGARFEFLENKPRASAIRAALEEGTFAPEPGALRLMLVGDSFLFGGKADADYLFSNQLRHKLSAENVPGFDGVQVLDLSTPGANTIVNFRNFETYLDRFDPHVLMWVYSRNDVYTSRKEGEAGGGEEAGGEAPPRLVEGNRLQDRVNRAVRGVQGFLFRRLKTLRWALKTMNTELKLRGVLVPGTQHHHLIKRSHAPDFEPWLRSRELLEEMARTCRERGVFVLVFNSPYLHMLENYHIYGEQDRVIEEWFRSLGVDQYVNGVDFFLDDPGGEYAISRFDLHPNEAAHSKIADGIHRILADRVPPRVDREAR